MGERRKRWESSEKKIHISASKDMYPTSTTEVPQNDVPPVVKGMKMAVTAMNGMSGRKKICQRSSPPRARNVTIMSTVATQAVTNSNA